MNWESSFGMVGRFVIAFHLQGDVELIFSQVPKSVAMATWYFQLASDMDNPNAMNDLAFCFRYGHGVTKADHQAAKLYRKAAKHGLSLENNSWIWDSQYNDGGDDKNE